MEGRIEAAAAGATLTPHMEDTAGKAGPGAAEDVEKGSLAVHSVCRQWISKGAGKDIPTIFTLTTSTPSPPPSHCHLLCFIRFGGQSKICKTFYNKKGETQRSKLIS